MDIAWTLQSGSEDKSDLGMWATRSCTRREHVADFRDVLVDRSRIRGRSVCEGKV